MAAIGHSGRSLVPYEPDRSNLNAGAGQFRVLSYNVYADLKCRNPDNRHCSVKNWAYRSVTLLQEIMEYDADIVCLQDVDQFRTFWQPKLAQCGYDSVYKKKTDHKGKRVEGVLVAFKTDNLSMFKTVELELNDAAYMRDDISRSLFDNTLNDDVALIVFLRPWKDKFLKSAVCVVSAMTSDLPGSAHSLVRGLEVEYICKEIEKANLEFQLPVLIGISLYDDPSSPAYHILRTGRAPTRPELPRKPKIPTVTPTCRGSVRISWHPPFRTMADPPVLNYKICYRPGGSTTLSFRTEHIYGVSECIQYTKKKDERGVVKMVALEELAVTLTGLNSEMAYEFKVCAVNDVGDGVWSDPTPIVVLHALNRDKKAAKTVPAPILLKSIDEVYRIREVASMEMDDRNASFGGVGQEYSSTHLTPRLIDGTPHPYQPKARVLPMFTNARSGWDESLHGEANRDLKEFLHRERVLRKSALRDMKGNFSVEVSDTSDGRYAREVVDEYERHEYDHTNTLRWQREMDAIKNSKRQVGVSKSESDSKTESKTGSKINKQTTDGSIGGKDLGDDVTITSAITFDEMSLTGAVTRDPLNIDAEGDVLSSNNYRPENEEGRNLIQTNEQEDEDPALLTVTGTEVMYDSDAEAQVTESQMDTDLHIIIDTPAKEAQQDRVEEGNENRKISEENIQQINYYPDPLALSLPLPSSFGTPAMTGAEGGAAFAQSIELGSLATLSEGQSESSQSQGKSNSTWSQTTGTKVEPVVLNGNNSVASRALTIVDEYLQVKDEWLGKHRGPTREIHSQATDDDVILDAHAIMRHVGAIDSRQLHTLRLRSAYERYGVASEPVFTMSTPFEGDHNVPPRGVQCVDYIFYSHDMFRAHRIATLPGMDSLGSLGEDPREPLQIEHPLWKKAPAHSVKHYAEEKIDITKARGSKGIVADKYTVNSFKEKLKRAMAEPHNLQEIWMGTWHAPAMTNTFRQTCALPNHLFASTHLALLVEFDIREDGNLAVGWR